MHGVFLASIQIKAAPDGVVPYVSVWPIVLPGTNTGTTITFSQARLKQALRGSKPCDVNVVFERLSATRSARQNRAWWSVIIAALSEHLGEEAEDVHDMIKVRFLSKKILVPHATTGEVVEEITIGGSTRKLDKMQFNDLIERVQRWAAKDLEFVIPDPDPRLRTREF